MTTTGKPRLTDLAPVAQFFDLLTKHIAFRKLIPMAVPSDQVVDRRWLLLFAAWLVATASTLGALFLGEVMGYTPCVLCWYQRIAMFPLVLVLAAGLFPFDARVVRYAMPLAVVGASLALFHMALVAGWIPEGIKPCQQGVPCSDVKVVWFGFVTIPLLSVLSFLAIVGLLFATQSKGSR